MNISSKCAGVLSYQLSKLYKYACVLCLITIKHFFKINFKMASSNAIVAETILEEKLADLWLDYPCLYIVRSPDLKNTLYGKLDQLYISIRSVVILTRLENWMTSGSNRLP